jgi:hypothetical protein
MSAKAGTLSFKPNFLRLESRRAFNAANVTNVGSPFGNTVVAVRAKARPKAIQLQLMTPGTTRTVISSSSSGACAGAP